MHCFLHEEAVDLLDSIYATAATTSTRICPRRCWRRVV
jgi:hypothetical protein